jgi:hypothetical protein
MVVVVLVLLMLLLAVVVVVVVVTIVLARCLAEQFVFCITVHIFGLSRII